MDVDSVDLTQVFSALPGQLEFPFGLLQRRSQSLLIDARGMSVKQGRQDLLALRGSGQQKLPELALRQQHGAAKLEAVEAQEATNARVNGHAAPRHGVPALEGHQLSLVVQSSRHSPTGAVRFEIELNFRGQK